MAVRTKTQKSVTTSTLDCQPSELLPVVSVQPVEMKTYGTENFKIEELEFLCKVPDDLLDNAQEVLENLQVLRSEVKRPIKIIPGGGYRDEKANAQCKGAKDSQHMQAKASDIRVEGLTPTQVRDTIIKLINAGKMKRGGVGLYSTFVHYDVRGSLVQWNG